MLRVTACFSVLFVSWHIFISYSCKFRLDNLLMRKPGANAPGFVCSDVLPLYTAGDIGDFNALRLEFVADTVGLGEVFGLFRVP